jgi:hypothetical protein
MLVFRSRNSDTLKRPTGAGLVRILDKLKWLDVHEKLLNQIKTLSILS